MGVVNRVVESHFVVSLKELRDENVLLGLGQLVLHVIQELGHTDVIVLQELDDVHPLPVLRRALRHVRVLLKELCN